LEEGNNRGLVEYKNNGLTETEDYPLAAEPSRGYYAYIEEESNLRDYIDVVLRRKWIVISCLAITVVTVAIASLLMSRIYKAEATIEIAPDNPKITTFQDVVELDTQHQQTDSFYETQYKLIESRSLAQEVISALKLDLHPEFASEEKNSGFISFVKDKIDGILSAGEKKPDPKEIERERLAKKEELVDAFLDRLKVEPDKRSRLVQISFESSYPELSAKVANTLADKYIGWSVERKLSATKAARQFLQKQLVEVKAKLERAEEDLNAFAKSADIVTPVDDENFNLTYKQLADLNDALSSAETAKLKKEALYREVEAGNYSYIPQVISDRAIQDLNEEYTKLKAEYDNMSVLFGHNYPEIKQLAAQLGRLDSDIKGRTNAIAESIKTDYQAASRRENILRERTEEQKAMVAGLNDKTVQYRILEREVETNKSIYESLLQRLKETEVTSGIRASNIQVVDYASIPILPYKPKIALNMVLAVLMGLLGGIFLAFVFEHFDSSIRDEEELKRRFSLPFLGAIPLAGDNELKELERVVFESPKSIVSEAFRVIRTSILYSSSESPPRTLLVTSTQPFEGKTTSASNLALSFTQSELKVIIVDADLRRPRLHEIFVSNGNSSGLSTYLVGKKDLSGVINRTSMDGLDVIYSGPIPPNPAELLGSKKMRELIEGLLERYDQVILDAPPVTGFADSRLLSSAVDGVMLVTSIGITQRQTLSASIGDILNVKGRIIGVIVNRIESRRSKYVYEYYHHNSKKRDKRKRADLNLPGP
jgi:succinoglycan biosynthesis transport protein ExoP